MSANPPADAGAMFEVGARAEAERSGHPFVEFRDGDGRSRFVVLDPTADALTVGRRSTSDLVLEWDDQVSRLHARFERVKGAWELVDDGLSSNGTFVNEQRLHGRSPLHPGDVLRFGSTQMTFRLPRQAAVPGVEVSSTQRRVLISLCRPYKGGNRFATPATDEQIAEDLVMSIGEVRTHLRVLCAKLGLDGAAAASARVRLVESAFAGGLVTEGDL